MPQDLPDLSRIPTPPSTPLTGRKEAQEESFLIKDLQRKSRMSGTVHFCKRALLVVCFGIIVIVIFIRVYSLVMPLCWQWLTEEQTAKIDEFFVHGTIGAIIAAYFGKYFREQDRD